MNTRLFSTLLFLTLLLAACSGTSTPAPTAEPLEDTSSDAVTAEGTLLPERAVELAFPQGGVVSEVLAQPGESIAADAVIMRLRGIESAQVELAAARLEVILAQQALDAIHRSALLTSSQAEQALLEAQDVYETLAGRWNIGNEDEATDLEAGVEDYILAEEDYRAARDRLDEVLDLDEDDRDRQDAQEEFDSEKASLEEAYADLQTAMADNDKMLDEDLAALLAAVASLETARELQSRLNADNLDPDILAAAEARLVAAGAHLAAAQAAVELYELRAPFAGKLLHLALDPGEPAPPLMPVAFLADTSHWIVETKDLAELDVARISVGDPAVVRLDAFPGEEFSGVVTRINPVGRQYLGDMTYQITILLDAADARFLWNMTAVITVTTAAK